MCDSDKEVVNFKENSNIFSEMQSQKHENMIASFSNSVLSDRESEHENYISATNVRIKKERLGSDDDVASNMNFCNNATFSQGNQVLNNLISGHENNINPSNIRIKKEPVETGDEITPNCGLNESMKNSAVLDPNNLNCSMTFRNVTMKTEPPDLDDNNVKSVKKLSIPENNSLNEMNMESKKDWIPFYVQIKKESSDSNDAFDCKIKMEPEKDDIKLRDENGNAVFDVQTKIEKSSMGNENIECKSNCISKNLTGENAAAVAKQMQQSPTVKTKQVKSEGENTVPNKNPLGFVERPTNTDRKQIANGSFSAHMQQVIMKEEKEKSVALHKNSLSFKIPVKLKQKPVLNDHFPCNGQETHFSSKSSCKIEETSKQGKKTFAIKRPEENHFAQNETWLPSTSQKVSGVKKPKITHSETDRKSSRANPIGEIQSDVSRINVQSQMPTSRNESEKIMFSVKSMCPIQEADHIKRSGENLENSHKNHRKKMEKEKLEKKVKNEIAKILHPLYKNGTLTKKLYFDIERKSLLKVLMNCKSIFNPEKIKKLVCEYVVRMTKV